jgi:hypothetical protein
MSKRIPEQIRYTLDFGPLGEQDVMVGYHYTPAQPGRISGPPENCYPDEPDEIELVAVSCEVLNPIGLMALMTFLEDDDRLADQIREAERENADDGREEYEEAKAEQRLLDAAEYVAEDWR